MVSTLPHRNHLSGLRRCVFCLLLVVVLSNVGCSRLFFLPDRVLRRTPQELGLEYQDIHFSLRDGTSLHAWLLKGRTPTKGLIIYLHGNAQNITAHVAAVAWLPQYGFDVLAIDYRGYGQSGGSPSDVGTCIDDLTQVFRQLAKDSTYARYPWIIYGQSLGAALGIHLVGSGAITSEQHAATDTEPRQPLQLRAVIAESSFSSYRRITQEKLGELWLTWPFQLPLASLVGDSFAPTRSISGISPVPVLLIHGTSDSIVGYQHSVELYANALQPKELWLLPGIGHIEALVHSEYRSRLLGFLSAVLEPADSHLTVAQRN